RRDETLIGAGNVGHAPVHHRELAPAWIDVDLADVAQIPPGRAADTHEEVGLNAALRIVDDLLPVHRGALRGRPSHAGAEARAIRADHAGELIGRERGAAHPRRGERKAARARGGGVGGDTSALSSITSAAFITSWAPLSGGTESLGIP